MAREPRPAVLYLRMSSQLREGLREAAEDAGCSLNAFAVQVLAAAAGDPTRFRVTGSTEDPQTVEVRDIDRDALGFPLDWKARWSHSVARNDFIGTMDCEMPSAEVTALVKRLDAEDPAYFVEWKRIKDAEREGRESADLRDGA